MNKNVNKLALYTIFLCVGIVLGKILYRPENSLNNSKKGIIAVQENNSTIWTCSMHPQIRMHQPGKCPLCAMDLIPLETSVAVSIDPNAIELSPEAIELANVHTAAVTRAAAEKIIRVYGRAKPNERLIQNLTSPIAGRVETLFVNSAGFSVSKGQLLAYIFSPEFMTAQQELLVTKKMKSSLPELYEAARDKLRFWKITDDQIDAIEQSENIWPGFPVMSPTDGVITSLRVNLGDYISQGTVLFELADFSILRVEFDVYESDLPFLKVGDSISFIFQALPQRKFGSKITIIDPMLDPVTRVFRILTEIKNTEGIVKPQMFATGIIRSKVGNVNDKPLVIPRSAVLWTGKRSIVYVKLAETDRPTFLLREVILGASLGDRYIVESGLSEGEEIVVEGAFSIDAAAQLAGKKSMMSME